MTASTDTGLTRRTWRTAVIVFLAILLGGTGLTGAHALWSKQATVTANVQTGFWVQPNFEMPMTVTASRLPGSDTTRFRGVQLDWAPTKPVPEGVQVTYSVVGKGVPDFGVDPWIESGLPYQGTDTSQRILVSRPYGATERWTITVTPYIDGIAGKPTSYTFRINLLGTLQPA